MGKFSKTLNATSGRRTDNAPGARRAKAAIRENVLNAIGADKASVFDAFSGEGQLHRQVWHQAARYTGCDRKFYRDDRHAFVADNRRVMRAIDLSGFNILDADAYGSPWEQLLIWAARRKVRPGETIGVCLTEGSALKIKMGTIPYVLADLAGLNPHAVGAARQLDQVINRAIAGLARRMGCRVVDRWQADGRKGSSMRYVGLVLQSLEPAPALEP